MAPFRSSNQLLKRFATSPILELLERLGYLVRGLLYGSMGGLAFALALNHGGQGTDLSGALRFLVGNSFGRFILLFVIVGLSAYSLWGLTRAIYDPLHRGHDAPGLLARLGFLTSAFSYALVVVFALQLLVGSPTSTTDSTKSTVAALLTHPGGGPLTILLGLVALAVGLGQFLESYRATFAHDLKATKMSDSTRAIAISLGRFGVFSRGVIFILIGWFLIQAGLHHAASEVQGFGGAFVFLLNQPFGRLLLAIVAAGFVALALHSVACARYIRLMCSAR
jgi:hypothetical protein